MTSPMLDRHRAFDSIPDEVVLRVFSFTTASGITLSALTQRWRQLALATPVLWQNLCIKHDRDPAVLSRLVSRTGTVPLDIEIRLEAFRYRFCTDYAKSLELLVAEIARWRSLRVFATNPVLHTIRNRIASVPMPQLEHLELVQTDTGQVQHMGPFILEGDVFRSLVLERTTIFAGDATMLVGLRRIRLVGSSLAMVDENKLLSLEHPASTPDPRPPSMAVLEEIALDGTNPAPDGLSFSPSFSPTNITTVSLARLVAPSLDIVQALSRFYGAVLSSPALRRLSISDIHGHALVMLLSVVRSRQFPALERLEFTDIDTAGINDGVVHAFADGVDELILRKLDPEPFVSRKALWVRLPRIELDGRVL
ncbi:F-box domain-containing protein [Mycena kentingensis (nom. inval.)]|nr:F-box domain-containing protein [Mycena kentingensis (nom. inval.)]